MDEVTREELRSALDVIDRWLGRAAASKDDASVRHIIRKHFRDSRMQFDGRSPFPKTASGIPLIPGNAIERPVPTKYTPPGSVADDSSTVAMVSHQQPLPEPDPARPSSAGSLRGAADDGSDVSGSDVDGKADVSDDRNADDARDGTRAVAVQGPSGRQAAGGAHDAEARVSIPTEDMISPQRPSASGTDGPATPKHRGGSSSTESASTDAPNGGTGSLDENELHEPRGSAARSGEPVADALPADSTDTGDATTTQDEERKDGSRDEPRPPEDADSIDTAGSAGAQSRSVRPVGEGATDVQGRQNVAQRVRSHPRHNETGGVSSSKLERSDDAAQRRRDPGGGAPPQNRPYSPPPLDPPITIRLSLPNARAGERYDAPLVIAADISLEPYDGRHPDLRLVGDRLRGTPSEAGEFQIALTGHQRGRRVEIIASLVVVPDARALWSETEVPSSRSLAYWKEDEYEHSERGEHLFLVGASRRGRAHARKGSCRDDDFIVALDRRTGWNIAAVADGAGSARFSREGSKVAVQKVAEVLPELLATKLEPQLHQRAAAARANGEGELKGLGDGLWYSVVVAAHEAARQIEKVARDEGGRASDFSTTLLMAVAKEIEGRTFIATFSIGDGAIVLVEDDVRAVDVLTTADEGEYAGQTRFLHSSEFQDAEGIAARLRWRMVDRFEAIVLMTDGITDPKFPSSAALRDAERWRGFLRNDLGNEVHLSPDNERIGTQLLAWMDFFEPGHHDDRTIALMLPRRR